MDIRIVETMPMSGILSDPFYKLDGTQESVSLDWTYLNKSFDLIDRNIDYSRLPINTSDMVKKAFLTYNGISCQTGDVLETVVMESGNEININYDPQYANSNEWLYQPSNFRVPKELQSGPSNDLLEWGYPYSQGITLKKVFLNSMSNILPPLYTAYYRQPTMTTFEISNVVGTNVYTDGWYSSYILAIKKWSSYPCDPGSPLTFQKGIIMYSMGIDGNFNFYVNTTGSVLPLNTSFTTINVGLSVINLDNASPGIDTLNWSLPSFQDWKDLMKNNYVNTFAGAGGSNINNSFTGTLAPNLLSGYSATLNQSISSANNVGPSGNLSPVSIVTAMTPVFYIECNHLATPDLNYAILYELKKLCGCCKENKFNMSHIELWVKLRGKREAAFIYFNEESFKASQEIIEGSRTYCHCCLGDDNDCNFKYNTRCL